MRLNEVYSSSIRLQMFYIMFYFSVYSTCPKQINININEGCKTANNAYGSLSTKWNKLWKLVHTWISILLPWIKLINTDRKFCILLGSSVLAVDKMTWWGLFWKEQSGAIAPLINWGRNPPGLYSDVLFRMSRSGVPFYFPILRNVATGV